MPSKKNKKNIKNYTLENSCTVSLCIPPCIVPVPVSPHACLSMRRPPSVSRNSISTFLITLPYRNPPDRRLRRRKKTRLRRRGREMLELGDVNMLFTRHKSLICLWSLIVWSLIAVFVSLMVVFVSLIVVFVSLIWYLVSDMVFGL